MLPHSVDRSGSIGGPILKGAGRELSNRSGPSDESISRGAGSTSRPTVSQPPSFSQPINGITSQPKPRVMSRSADRYERGDTRGVEDAFQPMIPLLTPQPINVIISQSAPPRAASLSKSTSQQAGPAVNPQGAPSTRRPSSSGNNLYGTFPIESAMRNITKTWLTDYHWPTSISNTLYQYNKNKHHASHLRNNAALNQQYP